MSISGDHGPRGDTFAQSGLYDRYALKEFPDFVVLDTTYRCNVICGMCHLASKTFHRPSDPDISIDLIKRMIPLLKRCRSVFLLGRGEPLMHPKIYEIIGLIKDECPDIYMSFVSNGLLLTPRNIGKLLDRKLDRIHISLDGPDLDRGHPQFERAKRNLKELASQKSARAVEHPVVHINYVIGMDNLREVIPTLEFGIEVGIEGMTLEPLRILEPMPDWDDYILQNSIYDHLDEVVPVVDKARVLAVQHGIQITSSIPTNLRSVRRSRNRKKSGDKSFTGLEGKYAKSDIEGVSLPVGSLYGLKCDRPFKMLRVEMSGDVFMCPAQQPTRLNAFQVDPIEIWNSERVKEVRCRLDTEEYDSTCLDCHILKNRLTFDAENERTRLRLDDLKLTDRRLVRPTGTVVALSDHLWGEIDEVKAENGRLTLTGWAADLETGHPCMFIIVFVGEVNCAVARPTARRPDVAETFSKPLMEVCGFTISSKYPKEALLGDPSLHVWAIDKFGMGHEIATVPFRPDGTIAGIPRGFSLTEEGLTQSSGAIVPVNHHIIGQIEQIRIEDGQLTAAGWAVDSKSCCPCMFMVLFVGDSECLVVRATKRRPDVASVFANPLVEACGFTVSAYRSTALVRGETTIRVWAIDSGGEGQEILAKPLVITDRAASAVMTNTHR